jgi:hypothetical protein
MYLHLATEYEAPEVVFRAPPGAMAELEGRAFEWAMHELLSFEEERQRLLIAHQSPCLTGTVPGSVPYAGCEVCDAIILLTKPSIEMVEDDPDMRLICVECAWAATQAVAGLWSGVCG